MLPPLWSPRPSPGECKRHVSAVMLTLDSASPASPVPRAPPTTPESNLLDLDPASRSPRVPGGGCPASRRSALCGTSTSCSGTFRRPRGLEAIGRRAGAWGTARCGGGLWQTGLATDGRSVVSDSTTGCLRSAHAITWAENIRLRRQTVQWPDSRRVIIAFDFKEALAFEGETGPYLQYSTVGARNIIRKFQETHPAFAPAELSSALAPEQLQQFFKGEDGAAFWELTLLAAQLDPVVAQAIASEEPAVVAKYAFRLGQGFNNFYHHFHILGETDPARQQFLLYLVHLTERTLTLATEHMGIEIPERM